MFDETKPPLLLIIETEPGGRKKRRITKRVEDWVAPLPRECFEVEPYTAKPMRSIVSVNHMLSKEHIEVVLEPADDELIDRLLSKQLGWKEEF